MRNFSRLARKEEKRNLRQAITWAFLTLLLALALIFLGIPALIKMAVFLGNIRASSLPVETKDTLPPVAPIFDPVPEATNDAQLKLSGLVEPGAALEFFFNGASVGKIVGSSDGVFSLDDLTLTSGKNEVYAYAIDNAGNKSAQSEKIDVWYDNTPPQLEITQPKETASNTDKDKTVINGRTELETTVLINDHFVIVNKEGNFIYSLSLSSGENTFKIVAFDLAGNKTEQTLTINYSP